MANLGIFAYPWIFDDFWILGGVRGHGADCTETPLLEQKKNSARPHKCGRASWSDATSPAGPRQGDSGLIDVGGFFLGEGDMRVS